MNKLERNRNKIMEFTFYPYEGFGPVKFLMSRDEVRKIIGLPYKDVTRMTNNGPYVRDYPLFNLKSNYDLWLKTEKRQKCGRNVAFSPRIGHFGRESATVDKKEREPEFELRFPEFRQKNGRDREI